MLKPPPSPSSSNSSTRPGPSGYESAAAKVWRDEAAGFAAEVQCDVHGNSMAVVNPGGSPTIMLAGTSTRSA
jgi:putative aminopeptidase FrvX